MAVSLHYRCGQSLGPAAFTQFRKEMTSCRHCRAEVETKVEEEENKVKVSRIRLGPGNGQKKSKNPQQGTRRRR